MWTWFFSSAPVTNYSQATLSDTAAFGRFHNAMLNAGVWLPPSQFEAAFLSTAHGKEEVAATIAAAKEYFSAAE
jgi:glutamate-1-semialdehyde 2,1-aminomutase